MSLNPFARAPDINEVYAMIDLTYKQFPLFKSNVKVLSLGQYLGKDTNYIHYLCYVHTQLFLALYMCVFIFGFPCGYF